MYINPLLSALPFFFIAQLSPFSPKDLVQAPWLCAWLLSFSKMSFIQFYGLCASPLLCFVGLKRDGDGVDRVCARWVYVSAKTLLHLVHGEIGVSAWKIPKVRVPLGMACVCVASVRWPKLKHLRRMCSPALCSLALSSSRTKNLDFARMARSAPLAQKQNTRQDRLMTCSLAPTSPKFQATLAMEWVFLRLRRNRIGPRSWTDALRCEGCI
jgi:hypothetical protein